MGLGRGAGVEVRYNANGIVGFYHDLVLTITRQTVVGTTCPLVDIMRSLTPWSTLGARDMLQSDLPLPYLLTR
jgi:hypothetical protein